MTKDSAQFTGINTLYSSKGKFSQLRNAQDSTARSSCHGKHTSTDHRTAIFNTEWYMIPWISSYTDLDWPVHVDHMNDGRTLHTDGPPILDSTPDSTVGRAPNSRFVDPGWIQDRNTPETLKEGVTFASVWVPLPGFCKSLASSPYDGKAVSYTMFNPKHSQINQIIAGNPFVHEAFLILFSINVWLSPSFRSEKQFSACCNFFFFTVTVFSALKMDFW